jgi:hypothetical protein
MSGRHYYSILGLPDGSSDAAVKKRFRELAKKYHPDLNPDDKATETFRTLLDAYERILKKEFSTARSTVNQPSGQTHRPNAHERHQDFHRKAWERYERLRKEQEQELDAFYLSFLKGKKRWMIRAIGFLSLGCFLALLADEFLPPIAVQDRVKNFNRTSYQSFEGARVNEINTLRGTTLFPANYYPSKFILHPDIVIYQSAICRSNQYLIHDAFGTKETVPIHFTFYWARVVLYVFFLFSIGMVFLRKKGLLLVLGSWFCMYIVFPITTLFLLINGRILSIITLGNWP